MLDVDKAYLSVNAPNAQPWDKFGTDRGYSQVQCTEVDKVAEADTLWRAWPSGAWGGAERGLSSSGHTVDEQWHSMRCFR